MKYYLANILPHPSVATQHEEIIPGAENKGGLAIHLLLSSKLKHSSFQLSAIKPVRTRHLLENCK